MTNQLDNLVLTVLLRAMCFYALLIHAVWSMYAYKIHKTKYGKSKIASCIILNFIFCPLAIIVALGKRIEEK